MPEIKSVVNTQNMYDIKYLSNGLLRLVKAFTFLKVFKKLVANKWLNETAELIFCNNPKASGKNILFFVEGTRWCLLPKWPTKKINHCLTLYKVWLNN